MSEWSDAEQHVERAHELFELGRWEEAEVELRRAIALNPNQAEWHFNLGLTLEAAGRFDEALASFLSTHELDTENPQPLISLGVNCTRLGRPEEAIGHLRRAQQLAPDQEAVYCPQIAALTMLDRHDEAEEVFYMARLIREECPVCFFNLGESLFRRRVFERAAWCFKEAARLDPRMPRVHARLAAMHMVQGQFEQAYRLYLRDLREDPGSVETLLELGDLLILMARFSEASEKFRRVLELEPANVEAHFRLGKLASHAQRFDVAHVEFQLVQKLEPDHPGLAREMARVAIQKGQKIAARRSLQADLEVLRDDDPDLQGLADLLMAAEMTDEAEDVLTRLVNREPENAEAWRRLGAVRLMSERYEAGIDATRRARRLNRSDSKATHNLLLAYMESGQAMRAAVVRRQAERRFAQDPSIRRLAVRLSAALLRERVRATVRQTLRALSATNEDPPPRRHRRPIV